MLAHVEIYNYLSSQGEACKDKIEASKTPRRVRLQYMHSFSDFWTFENLIC